MRGSPADQVEVGVQFPIIRKRARRPHPQQREDAALFFTGLSVLRPASVLARAWPRLSCVHWLRSSAKRSSARSVRWLHRLRDYDVVPIDYRQQEVAKVVRAEHPEGVRIVYDHLGGPTVRANHRLLAPGGVLVNYAFIGRPGHVLADTIRGALRNRMLNLLPGKRTAICSLPREIAADPSRHQALLTHLFELARRARRASRVPARCHRVAHRGIVRSGSRGRRLCCGAAYASVSARAAPTDVTTSGPSRT
ncbi:hypothetical protein EDD27_4558 [Nonomuraea polychroma]|uniref:Zinc-binding dehydrogenase n=1 Tax=Nonomuraea polychroma TaxID=46176 RepID=A0A438M899_9ACTN|nr:hypothetical protein EDD27_4558 [Nonomuraea polychroma]